MSAKKVVITGGAGFIGSNLTEALLTQGFDVHVVDNYAGGKRDDRILAGAAYHEVDVRDTDALVPLFKDAYAVFHEAALPRVQYSIEHPVETFSVNAGGTVSVLDAARRAGVRRVIYAASSSAYGDQETLPLSEDLPPMPKSPYGLQKYVGELALKTASEVYGQETVSLRYFNVYGPRLDPDGPYALVIGKFLKQRKEGKPLTIWGRGDHTRDFTHVSDVVKANLLAMESTRVGKGEVINIGAGRDVTVNYIAELIGGPAIHEEERIEPAFTRADTRRAKELLSWEPTIKLEDGLKELKQLFGIE